MTVGTDSDRNTFRVRDLWPLFLRFALLWVGLVAFLSLDAPSSWIVGGTLLGLGTLAHAVDIRNDKRRLLLFATGLLALTVGIVGSAAGIRWLSVLGMLGFLASFTIGLLLLVDRNAPLSLRLPIYLRALSLPVGAIGGFTQINWLLWAGASGLLISVLLRTPLAMWEARRSRHEMKQ